MKNVTSINTELDRHNKLLITMQISLYDLRLTDKPSYAFKCQQFFTICEQCYVSDK